MPQTQRKLDDGSIPVTFIPDGEVRADPIALFPGTTRSAWRSHPELVDASGRLVAAVGAFLIRRPGLTALVDLGLGPVHFDTPAGATYRGGDLIRNLHSIGVSPADVDLVVYTHLHRDHVGWTSHPTPTGPALTFANARHVTHRAEWEHWQLDTSPLGPDRSSVVDVLSDRIEFCADGDEVADGLTVICTPGHTPGHIALLVERGQDRRTVIAGDTLHSPAQLQHPDWCFGSDLSPGQAAASRKHLLQLYGPDLLACGHFPPDEPGLSEAARTSDDQAAGRRA